MNALGTQIVLDLKNCDPIILNDLSKIRSILVSAAKASGVTILGESFHQFHPQGVTGILAIAESHFSIHTWPEYRYAAVDIFTCGTTCDPYLAARLIIEEVRCQEPSIIEVKRGVLAEAYEAAATPVGAHGTAIR